MIAAQVWEDWDDRRAGTGAGLEMEQGWNESRTGTATGLLDII